MEEDISVTITIDWPNNKPTKEYYKSFGIEIEIDNVLNEILIGDPRTDKQIKITFGEIDDYIKALELHRDLIRKSD